MSMAQLFLVSKERKISPKDMKNSAISKVIRCLAQLTL